MPTYRMTDSVFPACSSPAIFCDSDAPAGVDAVFAAGVVVGVELATTAVLALLAVVVVELFVVVFAELPQAEKSNAREAMLSVERGVLFTIIRFSFLIAYVQVSIGGVKV